MPSQRARILGTTRLVAGASILLAPSVLTKLLGLTPSRSASRLARLIGFRELAVGTAACVAANHDRDPLPGLLAISVADGLEAIVISVALQRRAIPADRGYAFVLADLGSALAGLGILARMRGPSEPDHRLSPRPARDHSQTTDRRIYTDARG
jgi:hypothetical protein